MIFAVVSNTWSPSPLLPQIQETFSISLMLTGLVVSVYSLSYGFLALPKAILSDKIGRKEVILPSLFIYSLLSILTGLAWNFPSLIFFRLIDGIAGAALPAIAFAYIADVTLDEGIGKIYGILMATFSASAVFSVLLSGVIAETYTWRAPFIIFGILGLLALAILWNIPESKKHSKLKLPLNRKILGIALAFFVIGFIAVGVYTYLGLFLENRYDLDAASSGIIIGLVGVAAVFGGVIGGVLADKIDRIKGVAIGYGIFAGGAFLLGFSVNLTLFILFLIIFLFGYMLPFPSLTAIAMSSVEHRGSVMGLNNFLFFAGGGIGAIISGHLYENVGFNGMAEILGFIAILFGTISLMLLRGAKTWGERL